MPISEVHLIDCMQYMATVPDGFFELAIVDPNYGISVNHNMGRRKGDKASNYKPADWDKKSPDKSFFDELFRISKDQIIWGANHFISKMPLDSSCWLLWDKGFSEDVTFAQFEMAWTSFNSTAKKYDYNAAANINRIHPTQKPVQLYKWLLRNYAKEGDKIFDSHLGSQSSRIACWDGGFDFWGCELDPDYFKDGCKRFDNHIKQLKIF